MIMHFITNLAGNAGAERMLCRLLSVSKDDKILVVSLMEVSARNMELAANPRVEFVSLGVSSAVGMLLAPRKVAAIMRREKPARVVCWMYHAMAVGSVAGKIAGGVSPVIWNVRQSLDDPSSMSFSTRFAVWVCRALSAMPAGVIYNSKRALIHHGDFGYRNRNAVVIPNGFFMPEPRKIVAKSPRVFGIAGRFHPQKDHDTFFKAAAIALSARPDARFRAAGHGLDPQNAGVASLVKSAGLAPDAVDLCGEISGMGRFYESIDVLALSSRTEGFPNVIAEAMSHGKPVVTTDVGDAAAIVGPAGFVVPPADPRALAGVMIKAMDLPPEEYEAMCRQARARTEASYGIDRIAHQFDDFVRSQPG